MLIHDGHRFIMQHKAAIEGYPLQTYISGLFFSPEKSMIRQLFQHETEKGLTIKSSMIDSDWSACLLTLEGHRGRVSSVAFSHDSQKLASIAADKTTKIWDAGSGACLQTFTISHNTAPSLMVFSHDFTKMASTLAGNSDIKIWDVRSENVPPNSYIP
jgi:WD40 repeat protein